MSDFDPEAIYQKLAIAGEAWVDKDAAASAYEFAADTMLAKCFLEADGNVEERKNRAKVSEQYQDARKTALDGRKDAQRAKVKYDTAKVLAELRRLNPDSLVTAVSL